MYRFISITVFGVLTVGCYTLQPTGGTLPEPGTQVALDVTEAGRIALGGAIGPEIRQLEGRLVSKEDGEYLIAVSNVTLLRGGVQRWNGERVRVKSDHVGYAYERKFHKGRSIALGVTVVAGVTTIILTRDLFGLGTLLGGSGGPQDSSASLRLRLP